MKRTIRRSSLSAGCLLSILLAWAGCSKKSAPPASADLFPTGQGSEWTYKGTAAGQPLNMGASITSSKSVGGDTTVVMRWTMNGNPVQEETYIANDRQVVRAKSGAYGSMVLNPPLPVIQYPMSAGKTWDYRGSVSMAGQTNVPASATLTVAGPESLKTNAGTFNAFRVDMKLTVSAQGQTLEIPNSYWFAPGAGMVRQRTTVGALTVDATVDSLRVK